MYRYAHSKQLTYIAFSEENISATKISQTARYMHIHNRYVVAIQAKDAVREREDSMLIMHSPVWFLPSDTESIKHT